jgi:hypothetical protein
VPAYGRKKTASLRDLSLEIASSPAPASKWLRGVKSAAADSVAFEWPISRQFGCPYLVEIANLLLKMATVESHLGMRRGDRWGTIVAGGAQLDIGAVAAGGP